MKKSLVALCLTLAMALGAQLVQAAEFEMNAQTMYGVNHVVQITKFVPKFEEISQKSNGIMQWNVFPIGSVVDPTSTHKTIKSGMLDLGGWSQNNDFKEFPYGLAGTVPFVYSSSLEGTKIFWQAYRKIPQLQKEYDSVGKLVFMYSGAACAFYSVSGPINSVNDLKGKRVIYITNGDGEDIKAWGGIPVFLAPTDVYVGLQRGMGDVFLCPLPMAAALKIYEVAKFVTPITPRGTNMLYSMNQELYNDLPKEAQTLLDNELGEKFSYELAEALDADVALSVKKFTDAGAKFTTLSDEKEAEFKTILDQQTQKAIVPKMLDYGAKDPQAVIDQIYAISKEVSGS